ncbi:peptidase S8/S53 domain-containing protein [Blastocladiella britannica]|nr:peptidase S8/S53 domain-containing protein [Blastocladiella britannica]
MHQQLLHILAAGSLILTLMASPTVANPDPRADPGPNPAAMPDPVALAVPQMLTGPGATAAGMHPPSEPTSQEIYLSDPVTDTAGSSSEDDGGGSGAAVSIGLAGLGKAVTNLATSGERYLVQLHDWATGDDFQTHISWLTNELTKSLPTGSIHHHYDHGNTGSFKGYCGTLHPLVAQVLATVPIVKSVERDQEVHLSQTPATTSVVPERTIVESNAVWGLARISQRGNPVAQPASFPYWSRAGTGADVYILDTGISAVPTDYAGRVVDQVNFSNDPGFYDGTGHGSHVSGTAAGTIYGVAKGANLVNVKVLNSQGTGAWSGIIAGINYAVARAVSTKRPSVLSMSISGPVSSVLNSAIQSAIAQGVHVVVAAGNAAADACTTSPASAVLAAPALNVVGAMNQQGQFSSFSNYGPCVTILAPGEFITSVKVNSTGATTMMSGTSMATPHVSGIIASILAQVNMAPSILSRFLAKSATTDALTLYRTNTTTKVAWLNSTRVFASDVISTVYG